MALGISLHVYEEGLLIGSLNRKRYLYAINIIFSLSVPNTI